MNKIKRLSYNSHEKKLADMIHMSLYCGVTNVTSDV